MGIGIHLLTLITSLCFPGRFDAQVFWAGFWTRSLTLPEMNRIDCNPGDADIGYDGFELVGVIEETVSCDDFETNF